MYSPKIADPSIVPEEVIQRKRSEIHSLTKYARNIFFVLLIIIPTLTYFDDVQLFPFFGIEINVRFLFLLSVLFSVLLIFAALRIIRVPRIVYVLLIFAIFGGIVGIFQGIPIRWWLPPFLRLVISGFVAIAGYNLTLIGYFDNKNFHLGVIIALTIPLIFGIYQAARGLVPLLNGAFRISSTFFRSPVGFALFLAGMGLLLVSQKKLRLITLIYLAAVAMMILSTHSRQATLAFIIGLLILSYLQRRMKIVILAVIVLLPGLLLSTTLVSQFVQRLELFTTINLSVINEVMTNPTDTMWVLAGVDNSALLRVHTFVVGLDLFKISPVVGRGLGSFVMNYEQITGLSNLPAHNDYLMYLVETGILGFAIFVGMQFLILHSLLKKRVHLRVKTRIFVYSVAISYFAINVLSFLSNPYYFYEIQFWIWLGIGISIGLIQKERPNSPIIESGLVV